AHVRERGGEVLVQGGMLVEVRVGEAVGLIPSVHADVLPLNSPGRLCRAPAGRGRRARDAVRIPARRNLCQPRRGTDKTAHSAATRPSRRVRPSARVTRTACGAARRRRGTRDGQREVWYHRPPGSSHTCFSVRGAPGPPVAAPGGLPRPRGP